MVAYSRETTLEEGTRSMSTNAHEAAPAMGKELDTNVEENCCDLRGGKVWGGVLVIRCRRKNYVRMVLAKTSVRGTFVVWITTPLCLPIPSLIGAHHRQANLGVVLRAITTAQRPY
jgi:hypothetical protein